MRPIITKLLAICILLFVTILAISAFGQREGTVSESNVLQEDEMVDIQGDYEIATLGGGCFWCVEAVYEAIDGILRAVSGYAGGDIPNPSYNEVVSGTTGHAEVVQIHFDPKKINYEQVLKLFFKSHDPTTLNRQGYDVGTQYRSLILTHSDSQRVTAEKVIADEQKDWGRPIVTQVQPFTSFYEAEGYHQDFYANNPNYGYCVAVIRPKLEKLGLEGVDNIPVIDLKL